MAIFSPYGGLKDRILRIKLLKMTCNQERQERHLDPCMEAYVECSTQPDLEAILFVVLRVKCKAEMFQIKDLVITKILITNLISGQYAETVNNLLCSIGVCALSCHKI